MRAGIAAVCPRAAPATRCWHSRKTTSTRTACVRLPDTADNHREVPTADEEREALVALELALIAPAHCTGYRTAYAVYQARLDAFVQNTVGTQITLGAEL